MYGSLSLLFKIKSCRSHIDTMKFSYVIMLATVALFSFDLFAFPTGNNRHCLYIIIRFDCQINFDFLLIIFILLQTPSALNLTPAIRKFIVR